MPEEKWFLILPGENSTNDLINKTKISGNVVFKTRNNYHRNNKSKLEKIIKKIRERSSNKITIGEIWRILNPYSLYIFLRYYLDDVL